MPHKNGRSKVGDTFLFVRDGEHLVMRYADAPDLEPKLYEWNQFKFNEPLILSSGGRVEQNRAYIRDDIGLLCFQFKGDVWAYFSDIVPTQTLRAVRVKARKIRH